MRKPPPSPLRHFHIIGYLLLLPWILWLGAIGNLCIKNCDPTPIQSFYGSFYYSFLFIPFICHYFSTRNFKIGTERSAKIIAALPLIFLPVYIVILFQTI